MLQGRNNSMVTVRHLFFEQTQTIVIIGRKNDEACRGGREGVVEAR